MGLVKEEWVGEESEIGTDWALVEEWALLLTIKPNLSKMKNKISR